MYYLSKLVWFVLEPSNFLVFMTLFALIVFRRRGVAVAALLMLAILGLSPAGTLLLRPLEQRFPAYRDDGKPVTGVVVLGGAVDPEVSAARGQIALNEAGERITAMLEIARRFPDAKLVFTGGSGELAGILSEADAIERTIGAIAPNIRVTYERASRNTLENAEMTRDLVRPGPGERWLLVTSAWHMPRSIGLFRKAGWTVTAYPVDYRTAGNATDLRPFPAISHGLRRFDVASKEWIGLVFAYLTGKSAALLPAP